MDEPMTRADTWQRGSQWASRSPDASSPLAAICGYVAGHESRDAEVEALRADRDAEEADAARLADALETLLRVFIRSETDGLPVQVVFDAKAGAQEVLDMRQSRIESEAASGGG